MTNNKVTTNIERLNGRTRCYSKELSLPNAEKVPYLANMRDTAISGSRNGVTPIIWAARLVQFDWKKEFTQCMKNRDYLISELNNIGIKAWANPFSLIVVFPMHQNRQICRKFQLATDIDPITKTNIAHVVVLPHVTRAHLDELVRDLREQRTPRSRL